MKRTVRKMAGFGLVLIAGATLGMQLSNPSAVNSAINSNPYQVQPSVTQNSIAVYGNPADPRQQAIQQGGQRVLIQPVGGTVVTTLPSGQAVQGNSQQALPQQPTEQLSQTTPGVLQTPGEILLPAAPQTPVDRFADRTGKLLQQASQTSIQWVVSLLGSLTN